MGRSRSCWNVQLSLQPLARAACAFGGLLHQHLDAVRIGQQRFASLREHHATRCAFEKRNAHLLFEQLDLSGQRRL